LDGFGSCYRGSAIKWAGEAIGTTLFRLVIISGTWVTWNQTRTREMTRGTWYWEDREKEKPCFQKANETIPQNKSIFRLVQYVKVIHRYFVQLLHLTTTLIDIQSPSIDSGSGRRAGQTELRAETWLEFP